MVLETASGEMAQDIMVIGFSMSDMEMVSSLQVGRLLSSMRASGSMMSNMVSVSLPILTESRSKAHGQMTS
jgi:hypothetical protein